MMQMAVPWPHFGAQRKKESGQHCCIWEGILCVLGGKGQLEHKALTLLYGWGCLSSLEDTEGEQCGVEQREDARTRADSRGMRSGWAPSLCPWRGLVTQQVSPLA